MTDLAGSASAAFDGCTGLDGMLNLPKLVGVVFSTFRGCNKITAVDLGVSTAFLGACFINCTAMTKFIVRSLTVASMGDTAMFLNTPIANGTGYIYVQDDLVDEYKLATNWTTYASQIKGISEIP